MEIIISQLTSGEYIQMSGRAGRRGIDEGRIILYVDDKDFSIVGRELVKGEPNPLLSEFRLTYNMILNLLRVKINPEYMLRRSFYQFQKQMTIPTLQNDYLQKVEEYESFTIDNEEIVKLYYSIKMELNLLGNVLINFKSF